ncbi:acetylornithine deacetylase [Priestia megaterium]|uniref:Acetylornithine deacetylase/succinyl-diaminopimelate desuccinylase n=1 Tax=Priestia megaterium (strain DSM 319 / IMG 1521) TaxID=592022 RepID=D5DCC6_PRIM3|nr:acetylornithine deacetylase [Priestia megaterium]ADF37746.1 acetylornithine deacetylase/succinyl-diaminopimelate desuccinylase [Priestia megaterium DSM 319]MED4217487.1 acetylornithine deacetylase [Priestia megaterium]WEZ37013.1 acetylornithine deacetylase [Priestia megaterium DSM 319]
MEETIDLLVKQVEERKGELVQLLKTLVSYKTPAPPARNSHEAQRYVADFLKNCGFSIDMWDLYCNDPIVVGTLKGKKSAGYQSLIINGHMDVAEVQENEKWETNPFEAVVKDNMIIGRGVADMKGGLAGALFAVQLLTEAGIELPGDLIFESVVGEEVGEAGTLQCCQKGYTADFALVADTSDLHIQGQGGVITGWITIKSSKTYHDGTRRSMIHAGGGLLAASAIEKMAKVIGGLQELERHWAVTKSYPGFLPGTNTINPAVIEGGRHAAFIADECRLWITVHYYPNESYDQVSKEVEEYILAIAKADPWLKDNLPTFEWGGTSMIEDRGEIFPSLEIDENHAGVQLLANTHEQIEGKKPPIDVSTSVTDGGWLADAGISAAIYGPGNLANAHAVNEQLDMNQLIQYTKVMVQFIYTWLHTHKE